MKALTVQQPWAWAIMHGGKLVENRTQNWSYRGPLAIHAGMRWSARGGDVVERLTGQLIPPFDSGGEWEQTGVILGLVDLVDVHPDVGCCKPWGESTYVEHGGRERRRITHLVLEHPRPLSEPIPCKGALGLWTPPAAIAAALLDDGCLCEQCLSELDDYDDPDIEFGMRTLTPKSEYL